MLDLVPGEVADVDKSLYTVLRLCKHTEVGDVADNGLVDRTYRVLVADALPRVRSKLLQAEGHLSVLAVNGKNFSLNFVTDLEELLSAVKPWRPRHLGHMDKSFNTRLDLYESAIVSDEDNLTLDNVAFLDVGIEIVPRMRRSCL